MRYSSKMINFSVTVATAASIALLFSASTASANCYNIDGLDEPPQ